MCMHMPTFREWTLLRNVGEQSGLATRLFGGMEGKDCAPGETRAKPCTVYSNVQILLHEPSDMLKGLVMLDQ